MKNPLILSILVLFSACSSQPPSRRTPASDHGESGGGGGAYRDSKTGQWVLLDVPSDSPEDQDPKETSARKRIAGVACENYGEGLASALKFSHLASGLVEELQSPDVVGWKQKIGEADVKNLINLMEQEKTLYGTDLTNLKLNGGGQYLANSFHDKQKIQVSCEFRMISAQLKNEHEASASVLHNYLQLLGYTPLEARQVVRFYLLDH